MASADTVSCFSASSFFSPRSTSTVPFEVCNFIPSRSRAFSVRWRASLSVTESVTSTRSVLLAKSLESGDSLKMCQDFFHIPFALGVRLLRNPFNESSAILDEEPFRGDAFLRMSGKGKGIQPPRNQRGVFLLLLCLVLAAHLAAARRFQHGGEGLDVFRVRVAHRDCQSPLDCLGSLGRRRIQRFDQSLIAVGSQARIGVFCGRQTGKQWRVTHVGCALFQRLACLVMSAGFL